MAEVKPGTTMYDIENSLCLGLIMAGMRPPRTPVVFTLDGDWICQFLDVSFSEYYSDFDFQYECRRKASDASREALGVGVPMVPDFGNVLDASIYGGKVLYPDNAPPSMEPAISSPGDVPRLVEKMRTERDVLSLGLVPEMLDWRDRLKKLTGKPVPVGFAVKGPATIAGHICGMTELMMYLTSHPEEMLELIKCIGRTTIRYVRALRRRAGLPGVTLMMANDMAGLVSPQMYEKFFKPVEKRIFNALCPLKQARFYHADSRMNHQLEHLRDLDIGIVNFGPSLTVKEIREKMPDSIIAGHITPIEVLAKGTPEQVIEEGVQNIADAVDAGGRIILTAAGSVNPGTPFENLKAMMEAPLEYRRRHGR